MKTPSLKLEGHYYPKMHQGWGGCAEELFHYTSRYYGYTEAFLRNLSGRRDFSMSGYRAQKLSSVQRHLLAAILSHEPGIETARDIIRLAKDVENGIHSISTELEQRYQEGMEVFPENTPLVYDHHCRPHELPGDVAPLEPFLAIAERLQLPVAVDGHCVEVPLKQLAQHLDSPQPQIRENLQTAVIWLHDAGFHLHNTAELSRINAANKPPHP